MNKAATIGRGPHLVPRVLPRNALPRGSRLAIASLKQVRHAWQSAKIKAVVPTAYSDLSRSPPDESQPPDSGRGTYRRIFARPSASRSAKTQRPAARLHG